MPWAYSTLGGRVRSPYFSGGEVCGSSSGSAVSTALGLGAFSIGTQTGISIVCPAAYAGLVGFKPGPHAVDKKGVIPISAHLDAVGPITRTVEDARLVAAVLHTQKLPACCSRSAKSQWRVGVARNHVFGPREEYADSQALLDAREWLISQLRQSSHVQLFERDFDEALVEKFRNGGSDATATIAVHDQATGMIKYLQGLRHADGIRSVSDIVARHKLLAPISLPPGPDPPAGFNLSDPERRNGDQYFFEEAASIKRLGYSNATYRAALRTAHEIGNEEMLEPYFRQDDLDVLVTLTIGSIAALTSMAGSPVLTVPLGFHDANLSLHGAGWPFDPYPNQPFGIAISALKGNEADVLCFGEIVEQITSARTGPEERRSRLRHEVVASFY